MGERNCIHRTEKVLRFICFKKKRFNMKKLKMEIKKIEEETNPNGVSLLKITAESEGVLHSFGVKKRDFEDIKKRKSFYRLCLKSIREQKEEAEERKAIKEKRKNALDYTQFEGKVIDENE